MCLHMHVHLLHLCNSLCDIVTQKYWSAEIALCGSHKCFSSLRSRLVLLVFIDMWVWPWQIIHGVLIQRDREKSTEKAVEKGEAFCEMISFHAAGWCLAITLSSSPLVKRGRRMGVHDKIRTLGLQRQGAIIGMQPGAETQTKVIKHSSNITI